MRPDERRCRLRREHFGPWQTVWKRHRRYALDGTWGRVLAQMLFDAYATGDIDWNVSIDGTTNCAHQHPTNTTRPEQDTPRAGHRGLSRITRICPIRSVSQPGTASVAHVVGG